MNLVLGLCAAAGFGFIGYSLYQRYVKDIQQQFQFSVASFGLPKFEANKIMVPVKVKFDNRTPISVNLDLVTVDLFIQQSSGLAQIASVSQPVSIPPGISEHVLNPRIDPEAIITEIGNSAEAIISQGLKLRTDVIVKYLGINLPRQSFDNIVSLKLSDITKAFGL